MMREVLRDLAPGSRRNAQTWFAWLPSVECSCSRKVAAMTDVTPNANSSGAQQKRPTLSRSAALSARFSHVVRCRVREADREATSDYIA